MSSAVKACGPIIPPVEKWIKIPEFTSHCVQEVAKGAVQEFNIKYEDSLKFDSIYDGWYCELGPGIVKYKLHVKALDFLARLLNYEVIVHEEKNLKERIRKLVNFILIETSGHYVGHVTPPKEDKWIKIPTLCAPFVQVVAKFALEEFNKKSGYSLKYDSTYDGWYAEIGQDNIKFHLYVKAKDSQGYVCSYDVVVLIQHSLTQKIKSLLSFKVLDVKENSVQIVIKFVVEEFKIKYGVDLKIDSICEGSYIELGPNNLKYRLLVKVLDFLGRLLNYEVIVVEEKPLTEKIIKIISFTILETSGHCVGPIKPPNVKKWIKIPNLQVTLVQEIAKFALKEFEIKGGDLLKYDVTYEGWYCELGGDDVEFRLHIKAKDCLGRVHNYEAVVLIKELCTKKTKIYISFKCI